MNSDNPNTSIITKLNHFFFSETPLLVTHICLSITLISTIYYGAIMPLPNKGPVGVPATALGFLFREELSDPNFWKYSKALFLISIPCWIFNIFIRLSSTVCALSYLWLSSTAFENSLGAEIHSVHMVPMLILLFNIYYLFYGKEFSQALRKENLRSLENTAPRWGILMVILSIGMSHSWAGISKYLESGFGWANGVSLQLWVYLWGNENFMNEWIINSTSFSLFSQWSVLIVESSAVLAFFMSKKYRLAMGVILIGFHFVNQYMWSWDFLYWCPIILFCYGFDFLPSILNRSLQASPMEEK